MSYELGVTNYGSKVQGVGCKKRTFPFAFHPVPFTLYLLPFALYLLPFILPSPVFAQNSPSLTFRDSIPGVVQVDDGAIKTLTFGDVYIYPKQEFKDKKQAEKYTKLVRDVKKTLPYAKMIHATLIETYEYMQTLPNDQLREAHMQRMETELFAEYKPVMKKMTLTQGKLLIKLIDRECNQSSYVILKAFLGPLRAGFWNIFAGLFGASLKSNYDPTGKDAATERVVQLVEMGLI
ncbi:hypothetical protein AGMMS49982_03290 [Bacteroidia bacterium]|nr:hypothetical protein AGMMS49982_03290 [Bacteroidia bacterium]